MGWQDAPLLNAPGLGSAPVPAAQPAWLAAPLAAVAASSPTAATPAPVSQPAPAATPTVPSPAVQPGGVTMTPGVQGLTRGLTADVAGLPVDLATMASNAVLWAAEKGINTFKDEPVKLPRVEHPIGGSDMFANAASAVGEAGGLHTRNPADMSTGEQVLYGAGRGAGAAVGTAGTGLIAKAALAAPAAIEATAASPVANAVREGVLKLAGSVTKPYAEVAPGTVAMSTRAGEAARQAAPFVTDLATGAGGGAAATLAQQNIPDSWGAGKDIATLMAGLMGGYSGARAVDPVKSATKYLDSVKDRRTADPLSGKSVAETKPAASLLQQVAHDPQAAAAAMDEGRAFYDQNGVPAAAQPTSATMANDPGLIGAENLARATTPAPFMAKDTVLQQDAKARVDSTAKPAVDYNLTADEQAAQIAAGAADPRAPQAMAQDQIASVLKENHDRISTLEQTIKDLTGKRDTSVQAETDLASSNAPTRTATDASRALHGEVVDKGLKPMQGERTAAYEAQTKVAHGVPVDAKSVDDLLGKIEDSNMTSLDRKTGAQNSVPTEFSSLRGKVKALIGDGEDVPPGSLTDPANPVSGSKPKEQLTVGDLYEEVSGLQKAIDSASSSATPNMPHINMLRDAQKAIRGIADEMADKSGVEGIDQGRKLDTESFNPVYGRGPGSEAQKLRQDVNRDRAGGTMASPSETAGRFLAPGTKPETVADLKRMIDSSQDPAAATAAARDFVASRLADVMPGGKIDVKRLDNFIKSHESVFESFPEVGAEMKQLKVDAVNGRTSTGEMQKALDAKEAEFTTAKADIKQREANIGKSALGQAADKSPENFVADVFKGKDPVVALKSAVDTFKGNEAALDGLKRAVTDHIYQAVTNDAKGSPTMSSAKTNKTLGRYDEALRKSGLYSGKELNDMQVARQQINDAANISNRATVASSTAEQLGQAAKGGNALPDVPTAVKLLARYAYGDIAGGGKIARFRLMLQSFKEHGIDFSAGSGQQTAREILDRAYTDPALASHLLRMPAEIAQMPKWNKGLNRVLSGLNVERNNDEPEDQKSKGDGALKVTIPGAKK